MIRKIYLHEDKRWKKDLDISLDSKDTIIIHFGSANYSYTKIYPLTNLPVFYTIKQ